MKKNDDLRAKRLSRARLKAEFVKQGLRNTRIFFYKTTDSTNTRACLYAKTREKKSKEEGVFIARRQSLGRGRLGRSFVSSAESGLWMTLLTFGNEKTNAATLTTYAATVVCRAVEELFLQHGVIVEPKIKWVNDVYLGGRKLCGILAEGAFAEDGKNAYTALGIGINLYKTDFPEEIRGIATDLFTESGVLADRAALAARISSLYFASLGEAGSPAVMDEYRRRSFICGERITVFRGSDSFPATAIAIEDDGALRVRCDSGEEITLNSGEVSVRKIN